MDVAILVIDALHEVDVNKHYHHWLPLAHALLIKGNSLILISETVEEIRHGIFVVKPCQVFVKRIQTQIDAQEL